MIIGKDNGRITTGEIARIIRLFGVRYVRLTMQMGEPKLYETGERRLRIIDQVARNMHDEFLDYPAETTH